MRNIHDYSAIINQPYIKSKRHPPMSIYDRSAQFSPFDALTGHKEKIIEKERLTEERRELDDSQKVLIDQQIHELTKGDSIEIIHFIPDSTKKGGKYLTTTSNFKKIDEYTREIILMDGSRIKLEDIYYLSKK